MQVSFYHLGSMPLMKSCAKLLEKVLSSQMRAVVLCGSEERVQEVNSALWTYSPTSFLPHGSGKEGQAARQPIWVTASPENPNGAEVLMVIDGASLETEETEKFQRSLDLFDGMDPAAVAAARQRWHLYQSRGYTLAYWKQNEAGVWEKPEKAAT